MTSTLADRNQFLHHLKQSRLLTSHQLRVVVDKLSKADSAREIAKALVKWKLLTKYQARMLMQGRSSGFVLGPYLILEELGEGGMGRVYKARHQSMHRDVALKILSPQLTNTEKARALFVREVQAAGQLHHPNIIVAYDANEVKGRHYLAMEYVDGPNLEQLVRKQGPLPVGLACEIIRQAACGLQHAHDKGMVHRDIKPANLLLQQGVGGKPPVVKILDFGLARLHQPDAPPSGGSKTILAGKNVVMGTPDFLSPEQARNLHEVDGRADLYSLGCTFYFLLTGKVPFPGGHSLEKLLRHHSQEPTPVEKLRPEVPIAVAEMVRQLMAKKPQHRFQAPMELVEALEIYSAPSQVRWDGNRSGEQSLSLNTPPADEIDSVAPAELSLVDTDPQARAATEISGDHSILAWTEGDPQHRSQMRRALWWAVGIVGAGVALLLTGAGAALLLLR